MIVRIGLDKFGDFAYNHEHLDRVVDAEIQSESSSHYTVLIRLSEKSWVIRPVDKENLPFFFDIKDYDCEVASSLAALF